MATGFNSIMGVEHGRYGGVMSADETKPFSCVMPSKVESILKFVYVCSLVFRS